MRARLAWMAASAPRTRSCTRCLTRSASRPGRLPPFRIRPERAAGGGGRRRGAFLDGLGGLASLEAARADVGARRRALQEDAHALKIWVEAPLRGHHRV